MNYWNQTPLFRLLPAFIIGILAGIYVSSSETLSLLGCSVLPLLILITQVLFPKRFFNYNSRWLFGVSAHLLVFCFAWLITNLKTEINSPLHFSKIQNCSVCVAYLDDSKQEKKKSYKTTIRITAVKSGSNWIKTEGRCLVYISKDSLSEKLQYGDLVVFSDLPAEVKPPSNPSQFDYKRWLSYNQVYHQVFLAAGKWKLAGRHHGNSIVEMAIHMRERLMRIFADNNIAGDDYAVVSALLLGATGEIDPDIMNAYAASGALHVLSVSGLHVGIIYIALSALLFFMDRNKKAKILKAGILILFLWFYALLTGLSPAVLRSAAMLSYIVIGKALDRYTNMYNTLAASAMTLLCFEPHLLMQVGFQLSYLAVLGIVFLYKKFHLLLDPKTWMGKQIWSLTAVSVAAQLATFPLGLFYFHQFPNYFLFSNLLVIPISTVIIYGGIFLFIISPFAIPAQWTGLLLGKAVHLLNWTVITVEHLPYSLLQGISFTVFETYLIYIFLFMLVMYLMSKDARYVFAAAIAGILVLSIGIREVIGVNRQKQFVVYDVPKASAVNLIDGNAGILIADSSLTQNRSMMMFNIFHYWWDCGLTEDHIQTISNTAQNPESNILFIRRNILRFYDKTILLVNDSRLIQNDLTPDISIDYLILSKNLKVHVDALKKKFHFRQLIIDSSNSTYHAQRIQKEADKLGVACYSVPEKGAFVMRF